MKHLIHYLKLLLGGILYSLSFVMLLYPARVLSGGITGAAMIINLTTGFPIGIALLIMNIPLFVAAFRRLGLFFTLDSLLILVLSSVLIDVLKPAGILLTADPMLAAVCGGALCGFGTGIILSTGASNGGSEIIAKLIRISRPDYNVGRILLVINVCVVVVYSVMFRQFELSLYSILSMYVSSLMVDATLYGMNASTLVYIISAAHKELARKITLEVRRGVTILYGHGAYTGATRPVIMAVIKKREIADLRKLVEEIDPGAFVIVTQTKEVLGLGFDTIFQTKR